MRCSPKQREGELRVSAMTTLERDEQTRLRRGTWMYTSLRVRKVGNAGIVKQLCAILA
jgi:hypothetical protein